MIQICFNPVLGFLSVSTFGFELVFDLFVRFNPVLGFLSVSTRTNSYEVAAQFCFNPVLGFLSVSTSDDELKDDLEAEVSIPCWVF